MLLALSVVFAHSPWNDGVALVGGRNAVQLFYMISGFLIAHVLNTNSNYRDPIRFYANRALRIYPTYYVVALLSLIPALRAHSQFIEFYHQAGTVPGALLLLANAVIFGQDWAMFGAVHGGVLSFAVDFHQSSPPLYDGLLIPQAWTLGVELTFYLVAPFLVRRTGAIVAALVLSLLVRAWLFHLGLGATDPWSYRFFPAELSLFLFGALANRFGLPLWQRILAGGRFASAPSVAVGAMTAFIVVYFVLPVPDAVKTLGLMLAFVVLLPLTFLYQAKSRLDKRFGDLSYPIYIGHIFATLVVGATLRLLHLPTGAGIVTALNIVAAIALAVLLNRGLERPIERVRARIRKGQQLPAS